MSNFSEKNEYTKSIFWRGFLIWLMATIFYFFDNLLNVSPSAMKPELAEAFAKSASDLGSLSSCYLWAYGLMQIPAGILIDRIGPRKILSLASVFCAAGCVVFAIADSMLLAKIGRIFIGIGASVAVVGCSKIASVWFAPRRFAFFIGLMVSVGFSGAAFGLATVSWFIEHLTWRVAMNWAGVISFIIAILLFLIVRDKPKKSLFNDAHNKNQNESMKNNNIIDFEKNSKAKTKSANKIKKGSLFFDLKEVTACSQAWIASIYAGLMYVPTLAFGALWGIPFLVEAHGFGRGAAGSLVSLIFIGWACGGPIYGWISDHIGRRNSPMIFANIATLLTCLAIIYVTNAPVWLMGTMMFLLGVFSSGFIIAFAVMREKNRTEIAGTAIGFINMLNTFGGAFFQYFIGLLLDVTASDVVVTESGEKIFSLLDYQTALLSLPVCLVISLITLLFLKETFCKPKEFV